MAEGVDGLPRDATRPGRKKPLPAATIERVIAMTLTVPPGEATHWTGRAMARAARITCNGWAMHGLQPHRIKTFKLSADRSFPTKCRISPVSMSIRLSTRWFGPLMRSRRSRRSTVRNQDCDEEGVLWHDEP